MLDVINAVEPTERLKKFAMGSCAHIGLNSLQAQMDHTMTEMAMEIKSALLCEIPASTECRGSRCKTLDSPSISAKKSRARSLIVTTGRHTRRRRAEQLPIRRGGGTGGGSGSSRIVPLVVSA